MGGGTNHLFLAMRDGNFFNKKAAEDEDDDEECLFVIQDPQKRVNFNKLVKDSCVFEGSRGTNDAAAARPSSNGASNESFFSDGAVFAATRSSHVSSRMIPGDPRPSTEDNREPVFHACSPI